MRWPLSKRWIFRQCEKPIERLFAIVIVERILIIVIHFVLCVCVCVDFCSPSFSFIRIHSFTIMLQIICFYNFPKGKKITLKITKYFHTVFSQSRIETKKTTQYTILHIINVLLYTTLVYKLSCLLLQLLLYEWEYLSFSHFTFHFDTDIFIEENEQNT